MFLWSPPPWRNDLLQGSLMVMEDLVTTLRVGLPGCHLSQCCRCGYLGPIGLMPGPALSWLLDVFSKPCAAAGRAVPGCA